MTMDNDNMHEMTAIRTMEDEYISVSAPSNLPGGYELSVDSGDTQWTVQVVRCCSLKDPLSILLYLTAFVLHSRKEV